MAVIPFKVSVDCRKLFEQSGADQLLAYGETLIRLDRAYRLNRDDTPPNLDELLKAIHREREKTAKFFEKHKKANLRRFLTPDRTNEVDLRIASVIAFLMARMFFNDEATPLTVVCRNCSLADPEKRSPLEYRRIVTRLVVDFLIESIEETSPNPHIGLSSKLLEPIFDINCSPCIDSQSLKDIRRAIFEDKSKRSRLWKAKASTDAPKQLHTNDTVRTFVSELPRLSPAEMFDAIGEQGYESQVAARKRLCLSAYRHVSRLRKIYVDGLPPDRLPQKENVIAMGSTGTGKTYLLRSLFEILHIPHSIQDVTKLTECGYAGQDVATLPTPLLQSPFAKGNSEIAELGILALDEIDKLSNPDSNTHALVSRDGVQRGLLKMIEGTDYDIPKDAANPYKGERVRFSTRQILFIGIGAFSGWSTVNRNRPAVGFTSQGSRLNGKRLSAGDFERYGFGSELFGRFQVHLRFHDLDREQLKSILINQTIKKYRHELSLDGIELVLDDGVTDLLVERALAMGTGARSLASCLVEVMTDACYCMYSSSGTSKRIRLSVVDDEVAWSASEIVSSKRREVAGASS